MSHTICVHSSDYHRTIVGLSPAYVCWSRVPGSILGVDLESDGVLGYQQAGCSTLSPASALLRRRGKVGGGRACLYFVLLAESCQRKNCVGSYSKKHEWKMYLSITEKSQAGVQCVSLCDRCPQSEEVSIRIINRKAMQLLWRQAQYRQVLHQRWFALCGQYMRAQESRICRHAGVCAHYLERPHWVMNHYTEHKRSTCMKAAGNARPGTTSVCTRW